MSSPTPRVCCARPAHPPIVVLAAALAVALTAPALAAPPAAATPKATATSAATQDAAAKAVIAPVAAPATEPATPAREAPTLALKPGEYLWTPELAPQGPVVIVISLPEQMAYVYRNGVRIGASTVSSGKKGYETPTGVFTILQKRKEHYSNLYDNAPMPYMQRLTWDGVALHAGRVPGYPASHGCVRLPLEFSKKLFDVTSHGMTVVVANAASHAPDVVSPGLFAPVDASTGHARATAKALPKGQFSWTPERASDGPITLVFSTRDEEVVVMRGGTEIGRAAVTLTGEPLSGTHAYVLLDGQGDGPNTLAPGRPPLRWLQVEVPGATPDLHQGLQTAIRGERLMVPPVFSQLVYEALTPGATMVVTDEPLQARGASTGLTVIRGQDDAADAEDDAVQPEPAGQQAEHP